MFWVLAIYCSTYFAGLSPDSGSILEKPTELERILNFLTLAVHIHLGQLPIIGG